MHQCKRHFLFHVHASEPDEVEVDSNMLLAILFSVRHSRDSPASKCCLGLFERIVVGSEAQQDLEDSN